MEEQNKEGRVFTEKEVMDIVSNMQKDYNTKIQKYNETMNEVNGTLTRLNFLLKIIENDRVFSPEFVAKCVSEIEAIMTIPETTDEPKDEE